MFNNTELISVNNIEEDIILVSDKMLSYFTLINTWGLGQCLTFFGLIANVLNIVVFLRQGLHDPVNISLLGLSVSDLGSLIFHFLTNLCWAPSIIMMDLPFYPTQIMYFLVWIQILFNRVTTGMTAWIIFERCLCIVLPLKIKSIITPRRTLTFIIALNVMMFSSAIPVFYATRIVWLFDSRRNKSVLGIARIAHNAYIQQVAFWINNILPISFFIFITVCTVILVKSLQKNSKWKEKSVSSQSHAVTSSRDTKVVRMVTIISAVFIVCYAPGAVVFIFILIYPEMAYAGKQKNLVVAVFSVLVQFEGINASANIFIYLTMSSKFKSTFENLFCLYCYNITRRSGSNAPGIRN
ncbi:unnamed protein product [Candidula unifasciata]|uniref:G-protein coupled receptors family 1 profile domain-containing protein n=1 Tax=Candidula unifasciata TaxID=100452 RepID=A0A8S4A288_9EUPU|nr:unnamed protein product [Candidula unifasciata]